jgi:hypothetical protein
MPLVSRKRVRWTYVDDADQEWACWAIAGYASQNRLGGHAATPGLPALPKWLIPRRLELREGRSGRGQHRSVVVYSRNAPILAPGAFVNLNQMTLATPTTSSFYNRGYPHTLVVPERHPRKGAITRQPA